MIDIAKMTFIPLILSIYCGFHFSSCSKSEDLSGFYFPIRSLQSGLVYHYKPVDQPQLSDEYWYYQTEKQHEDLLLKGTLYSSDGSVQQRISERVVSLGVIQDSLVLYNSTDSSFQAVSAQPGPSSVFPFYKDANDTLIYKLRWLDPADSLEYILVRKKLYSGDTTWSWKGQNLDAVVFKLDESLETFREDLGMTNSGWSGKEVYAKGLGLVYFEKNISPEFTRSYRLYDRYDLEQFKKNITRF